MKQLFILCGFLLLSLIPTAAQDAAPYEISAGYNIRVFTEPTTVRIGLSGFYGSGEYNVLSRVSAEAEVSGTYRDQGPNGNVSIYSGMIGPQIYPFKHAHKITPFAHVLFGEGYYRVSFPLYAGFPAQVNTYGAFSWEVGGGVDITRTSHWAIRLIQLDYAQTKFFNASTAQNNYRASIGVVYRFGRK